MSDRPWSYFDRGNPASLRTKRSSPGFSISRMICDNQIDMVEEIEGILLRCPVTHNTCIFLVSLRVNIAPHREPSATVLLFIVNMIAPGNWHVINNPVVLVIF